MKKSSALVGLFTFLIFICSLTVGGYFLFKFIIIPKVIIPKICTEVETQLKGKLTIKNIDISRKGIILIDKPILYAQASEDIIIECSQIKIEPSYNKIFDSWKINKNNPEIPLNILISDIKLNQNPITLSGNIAADLTLKMDLKNKENIDWAGNIKLQEINIQNLPTLGSINSINGHIAVSKNSLVSYDIEGKINNEAAKLEVLINDFKNPELILQGELFPLKFNLNCKLTDEILSIKELKANYNKIKLQAAGQINDIKNEANANISADISLELEDLKSLPLEFKEVLKNINPRGLIKANLEISGPLKNIPALGANISIISPAISLLDHQITGIKLISQLKNGTAVIDSFDAMFLESQFWASLDVNIMNKNMPFTTRIKLSDVNAARFKEEFIPELTQNIAGVLSADINAQGTILDLSNIKIQADTLLSNLSYDKFSLLEPFEANIDLILKNLKDIIIKKFTLNDSATSLIIDGRITDISQPNGDLSASITTDLEKLKTYSFLSLPDTLKLIGKPRLDLKVSGNLLKYQSLDLPFKLISPSITLNQFNLDSLTIEGKFKEMKLDISALNIKLYEGQLSAKAFIDLADMKNFIFNSTAQIQDVNLELFSSGTKLIPKGLEGLLSTEIILSGNGISPENLNADIKGALTLKNAKINDIDIKMANANLEAQYTNTDIDLKKLKVVYKTIEATAKGKIKSALKDPEVNLIASTNLALEDLNKLPFDFKKTLNEFDLTGTVNAQIKASGPISQWQQMNIKATIDSEEMSVKKIQFSNVAISGDLQEKILNLSANLDSYDGSLDLQANAELLNNDFNYKGIAKINKVDIGKLIEESKIVTQPHKGIFSINADFAGQGTSLDTIESLIDFQLEQAQISGLDLMRSIGKLLGLNFLSDFEVTDAKGTLSLKNSIVHTEDTTILGPEASILTQGDINLDQSINLLVKLTLTAESAAQTSSQVLDKFFTFENEQYFTELDVKGTLTTPKPDLSKFMRDRMGSQVKKEVKKQIFKAFEGLFK